MKTINELIKSYLENEDKAVFGEILDVIRTGDSLFAVAARVTNNFFMGAENAKPAAYIFSSKAFADEFVKELKWEGYEVKSLEIRAAQRLSLIHIFRLECAPENGFGGNLQTGSQYRQTEG